MTTPNKQRERVVYSTTTETGEADASPKMSFISLVRLRRIQWSWSAQYLSSKKANLRDVDPLFIVCQSQLHRLDDVPVIFPFQVCDLGVGTGDCSKNRACSTVQLSPRGSLS